MTKANGAPHPKDEALTTLKGIMARLNMPGAIAGQEKFMLKGQVEYALEQVTLIQELKKKRPERSRSQAVEEDLRAMSAVHPDLLGPRPSQPTAAGTTVGVVAAAVGIGALTNETP